MAGDIVAGLDQRDKTIPISGASSELAKEVSRVLASIDRRIIMAARDLEKAHRVADSIRHQLPWPFLVNLPERMMGQRFSF